MPSFQLAALRPSLAGTIIAVNPRAAVVIGACVAHLYSAWRSRPTVSFFSPLTFVVDRLSRHTPPSHCKSQPMSASHYYMQRVQAYCSQQRQTCCLRQRATTSSNSHFSEQYHNHCSSSILSDERYIIFLVYYTRVTTCKERATRPTPESTTTWSNSCKSYVIGLYKYLFVFLSI